MTLSPPSAILLCVLLLLGPWPVSKGIAQSSVELEKLNSEPLAGEGVWIDTRAERRADRPQRVVVWFEDQFLGDGGAYQRRAAQFADARRTQLRSAMVEFLKDLSDESYQAALPELDQLEAENVITEIQKHWIINGFSCTLAPNSLQRLTAIPGVKKVFSKGNPGSNQRDRAPSPSGTKQDNDPVATEQQDDFSFDRYLHPWYTRYLKADKVWRELGVTGKGTLNVIQDGNFVLSPAARRNLYRNPAEIPNNEVDDDGNGLIDDVHGYDFGLDRPDLTRQQPSTGEFAPQLMHGHACALIICGRGTAQNPYELGLAPESRWAGVLTRGDFEPAIEWAIEQGADTYSMSFSIPGLGELRTHYRKVMEQGSFCGVFFVSGAGNFAQQNSPQFAPIPIQMRTPEDIPEVVFAAAGVQRDLSRTPFSSQGPVEWNTEHYQDGRVQKPEVCAFNAAIPTLTADGKLAETRVNGNSFAGPMFCGTIALMLSADPDLLPWDLKKIATSTAIDVGPEGIDGQTGHGLLNCYRAVKEVLRRKAIRDGDDPTPFTGRVADDELDVAAHQLALQKRRLVVVRVPNSPPWADTALQAGDSLQSLEGKPLRSRLDLRAIMQRAIEAEQAHVTLVVERESEIIEIQLPPIPRGLPLQEQYSEPEFR